MRWLLPVVGLLVLALVIPLPVAGQDDITVMSAPEPGTVMSTAVDSEGNMVFNTSMVMEPEEVKVILELKEKPTLVLKAELERGPLAPIMRAVGVNGLMIREQEARIAAEQAQTVRAMRVMVQGEPKVTYSKVFNGIATRVSANLAPRLEGLPNVKKVWPDVKMTTMLNESVPQIDADKVWKEKDSAGKSITGKDVVIAVIDSGIDYTHADFGSCTKSQMVRGNCAKIPYGHDFYNNDTDPMDDNGHGTHVASTAAGSGAASTQKFKGVAPDAKLLAYKVMSEGGWGYSSDIIAGIENATAYGADIISLSLGGRGDADSPLSVAVDNAVDAGVVVVVAAGNSGPSMETIGSPGAAKKAITVGAVDKNGNIARFSSRGPVYKTDGISSTKPDVVAPGVDICAARAAGTTLGGDKNLICENDRYISLKGTSMATPHVSGAAALLLQEHPNWNPAQVKAALMGSASTEEKNANKYGAGLINCSNAHESSVILSADTAPLVNEKDSGTWSIGKTFTLVNKGSKDAKFKLSTDFDSEVSASTSKEISVGAGQARTFTVTVSMDSGKVEDGWYYGIVTASSDDVTLSLPVSVAKFNEIEFITDNTSLIFLIVQDGDVKLWKNYPPERMVRLLPDGDYSVIWRGTDRDKDYWIGKKFSHKGSTTLVLKHEMAKNKVELVPVKEDGRQLKSVSTHCQPDTMRPCFLSKSTSLGLDGVEYTATYSGGNESQPNYVSNLPTDANWSESLIMEDEGKIYRFDYSKKGISSNTRLTNTARDLVDIELSYRVLGNQYRVIWLQASSFMWISFPGDFKEVRDGFVEHFIVTGSKDISKLGKTATGFATNRLLDPKWGATDMRIKTPNINVRGPDDVVAEWAWNEEAEPGVVNKKKAIGMGAPSFIGRVYASYIGGLEIQVTQPPSIGCNYFVTQSGDYRYRLISPFYELWDAEKGKIVDAGSLNCNLPHTFIKAEDGDYWLVMKESGYLVGRGFAATTVNASFTKARGADDQDPPYLTYSWVIVNGEMKDLVPGGKTVQVEAKILDDTEVSDVSFAYRKEGGSWKSLTPTRSGNVWKASVPNLADGKYDLRLVATDSAGNSLEQVHEPGFEVLTEKKAPQWGRIKAGPKDLVYAPEGISFFNASWSDNTRMGEVILEIDGKNYTDIKMMAAAGAFIPPRDRWGLPGTLGAQIMPTVIQPEYYKTVLGLSVGKHKYRWYAADFAGNWNVTPFYTFEVLAAPPSICGNGIVEGVEECDDGNTVSGDGCSENCTKEIVCGNGIIEEGEECDDGNNIDGDDCSSDCKLEAICGNGVVDVGEECDDGNTVSGDGCTEDCRKEVVEFAVCGNGVVEEGEECDDGNTISGDGCSADCKIEVPPVEVQRKTAEEVLTTAEAEISEATAAGADVVEAQSLLEEARQSFAAADYQRAIVLAQEARDAIRLAPKVEEVELPPAPPMRVLEVEWIAAALATLGAILGIALVIKARKAKPVPKPKRKKKK